MHGKKTGFRFACLSNQSQEAGVKKKKVRLKTNKKKCETNELKPNNNKVDE